MLAVSAPQAVHCSQITVQDSSSFVGHVLCTSRFTVRSVMALVLFSLVGGRTSFLHSNIIGARRSCKLFILYPRNFQLFFAFERLESLAIFT